MTERVLTLWVIYESPSDYPGKVVVRRQHGTHGAVDIDLEPGCSTLAEARKAIPEAAQQWPVRQDDPAVVEVWI